MSYSIIQCRDLSYCYAGKVALDQVSFELVSGGAPTGLVGPNGSGKTTLLSLLCGFLPITTGSVTLLGHQSGAYELSGRVAALPQDAQLDPLFTVGAQLCFYARLQGLSMQKAKNEARRVLEAVMLTEFFDTKPDALSHGMAKRVSIAQALIGSPELILLDEPTEGLDPVNVRNIRKIITELAPKISFIISSHDLSELGRICQNILFLENGIMQTKQLHGSEDGLFSRFMTLQMETCPAQAVIEKLTQIDAVIAVSNSQKNEFIVEYKIEPTPHSPIDIQILICLAENHWLYRQLSQGKTLEEQLFFDQESL